MTQRLGLVWAKGEEATVPVWAGPLLVATGSSLLTLWRPGITPDHPWADRRLLVVLPLVLLLAVAAVAWARVSQGTGRAISRWPRAAEAARPDKKERREKLNGHGTSSSSG